MLGWGFFEPEHAGRSRQEHPRFQREEPPAQHRQFLSRAAVRPRTDFDPHPPRRQSKDHRDRAPVRRFAVVRHRRRRRDSGRLHRGGDLMTSALINVPNKAKRGDVIEIKTLMSHIMETGYRHTAAGQIIPRDIITSFTCRYNGEEIFRADLFPAIAANPFITFFTVATESGKFDFEWIGDNGFSETASATISVE